MQVYRVDCSSLVGGGLAGDGVADMVRFVMPAILLRLVGAESGLHEGGAEYFG
jgi:hypothetical protein